MGSKGREKEDKKGRKLEKSYFDVLGLCCTSEVPLIEKILKPLEGVVQVSVIVPSRTVIVLHDNNLISQEQILKALNQARLEANVRVKGETDYKAKWPSPYVIVCGVLLSLSFLKYVYHPMQWLAVGAVVAGIWPIILRGVVAIRNFTLDVNILMIIAVVGTIALRDYEEAGTVVFLFTIAEWLESRASQKATAVMSSLLSMAPQKATIVETGEVVNVEDVKLNTIVAVKAGEMIPVDGIVVEGTCEVDEKTLTGESYPVPKQRDSTVWAGTVNVNGYINLKTTALAEDCAVARMAKLVEEAQNKRSNVQRLIDKCATFYTPAVILISAGLAAVPAALKVHNLRHWLYLSLVVLVSACPCGLILSTPVATFCALSRAASTGLLIKGGDYLEILAKIKTIAFDKTGTVTRGEFTLMKFLSLADDISLNTLLYWVSSIESKSSHPIASVLVDYVRSKSIDPKPENVEDFQNFPGEGLFGKIDGRDIYIGNKKLAQRAKCNIGSIVGDDAKEQGTSGYIYSNGALIGTFSLSDNCRSGAVDAIRELKKMGIRTALLTGDNQSAAMLAQEQVGNALDVVHAELLPEDKARIITDYKKQGATAMVGDGVNDAPALATADIGISMGVSGSALATETGHVVLMSNDIRKIPIAIKLARKTRNKVIQNIVISITTKAAVLATAFAWHPLIWLAVLVDVGTCLVVIFNSMLLLRGDHTGHAHGRKWFGLFSCHRHKNKCHSTGHDHSGLSQHCCTKSASPKTCNSARCSSQKSSNSCHTSSNCHTTSDQHSSVQKLQCCAQNASPELCKPFRNSSHDHTAPSQTSCKSHAAEVVHLSKGPHCCSTIASQAIAEPANCFLQDCSSSCKTDKHMNTASQPHKHEKHCSQPNQVLSKSLHCSSHQQCQSKTLNSCASEENLSSLSETHNNHDHNYHQSTCCDEDHCLEALESQVSCDKTDNLDDGLCCEKGICEAIEQEIKPECNHNHSEHSHISSKTEHPLVHSDHHHHKPNTCCEVLPVQHHHHKPKTCCTETVSEISRQDISMHCGSVGVLQDENVVSACKDHCHRPHGNHGAHQHYHGVHRADAVAKHACTSLRKRESGACCKSFRNECCSSHSQGHFVAGFGGLTEIVTE